MNLIEEREIDILEFEGEIVFEKSNQLKEQAKKMLNDREITRLIVDLSRVSFIDSSGVGMLISLFKNIRERGGRMVLTSSSENVNKVLDLTRLDQIMEVYDNIEGAEASF